tara:strand:- start:1004 stop:1237 length:234 start_codon:yes stop_codon:yes gene_type:complete
MKALTYICVLLMPNAIAYLFFAFVLWDGSWISDIGSWAIYWRFLFACGIFAFFIFGLSLAISDDVSDWIEDYYEKDA